MKDCKMPDDRQGDAVNVRERFAVSPCFFLGKWAQAKSSGNGSQLLREKNNMCGRSLGELKYHVFIF
ncbi:MAG: hypothetical protein LIO76_04290 [Clostridiales bacterium]|nr:hypothetical protein [Clostridiales bacterium]